MPIDPGRQISRILFVRTDRIGDVLMNLPAIRLLRQTFPKAWLTLLLDRSVAGLLKDHPDIDELMAVDADKLTRSVWDRWNLIRGVRKAGFDLAVVSNPNKFFHQLVFLAGIPYRLGYRRKWGFLLNKTMVDRKDSAWGHEIDLNLHLVSLASDKTWDGHLTIPVDPAASNRVESLMGEQGIGSQDILLIHAGTSNPEKRWPLEKFIGLSEAAQSWGNFTVILIGGEEEKSASGQIRRRASGGRITDWTGLLSLQELAALFNHHLVKALVSSDSGPVHIAWMSGTPVVALYAKNVTGCNPVRWGPRGPGNEVIFKPLSEITCEEVWSAVQRATLKNRIR